IAAAPHYLESWGDVELKKGHFALMQPTIRPLFDTKQFQDVLLNWTGNTMSYHDYIKQTWNESILGGSSFSQALHDGIFVSNGNVITSSETSAASNDDKTFVGGIIEDVAQGFGIKNDDAQTEQTISAPAVSGGQAARALASSVSSEEIGRASCRGRVLI